MISVNSISKSNNKRQILLSLTISNTSENNVYLSFDRSSEWPSLAGNDGVFITSPKISGLPVQYGSLLSEMSNYSKISAGKKTNVNLVFRSNTEVKADKFGFSSEIARYIDSKPDAFSMGISNIHLQ